MRSKIIVAGIDTGVGKTTASAVIVKAIQGEYWKPIQTGRVTEADSLTIERLTDSKVKCHPSAYHFLAPISPHSAAKKEGAAIDPAQIVIPATRKTLVIEMAGGVLSPLNDEWTQLDLYRHWHAHFVIVSQNYLGSINHSLLTFKALKEQNITPLGWIFNGDTCEESETYILRQTKIPVLARLPHQNPLNSTTLQKLANQWQPQLLQTLSSCAMQPPFGTRLHST